MEGSFTNSKLFIYVILPDCDCMTRYDRGLSSFESRGPFQRLFSKIVIIWSVILNFAWWTRTVLDYTLFIVTQNGYRTFPVGLRSKLEAKIMAGEETVFLD